MTDFVTRALKAKRESKFIEFKEGFDLNSLQDWCEIIKDIVAIANSGGGIILFGVNNSGIPINRDLTPLLSLDPADIVNKISKYTAAHIPEIELFEDSKEGTKVILFLIHPVPIPIVFAKPGTYATGLGKQKSAFSMGTVYFRHGAKSEPGNTEDIRKALDRQLDVVRKSWLKGVRKVVQAPKDAKIVTIFPKTQGDTAKQIVGFRPYSDPSAPAIGLTRNRKEASGTFLYEELSEGIFDEINNVVDANFVLTKGEKKFIFGQPVYYRIYAERQHVQHNPGNFEILARTAILDFYSPGLYWFINLPPEVCGDIFAQIYRNPKNPHVHNLIRNAIILGNEFSGWLYKKWKEKWYNHPQPPTFIWSFEKMIDRSNSENRTLTALRMHSNTPLKISDDEPAILVGDLLQNPSKATSWLSKSCINVFEGSKEHRTIARQLDYITYGKEIEKKAAEIAEATIDLIGLEEAGDVFDDESDSSSD